MSIDAIVNKCGHTNKRVLGIDGQVKSGEDLPKGMKEGCVA